MATLVIEQGDGTQRNFRLGRRSVVIGRQEGLMVQLDDTEQSISRRHLQIRYDETSGGYRVLDLKSRNGVFVNGRRITAEERLSNGDAILVGSRTLRFLTDDTPAALGAVSVFQKVGEREKSTIVRPLKDE